MMSGLVFDLIVAVVVLISALIAYLRGFLKEVLTILGLVGAFFAARMGAPLVRPWVFDLLADPEQKGGGKVWGVVPAGMMADIAAYGGTFFIVFVALTIASLLVSKSVESLGLGGFDRTLGIAFGAARGILLVALLYLPFTLMMEEEEMPKWVTEANSTPVIVATAGWMRTLVATEEDKDKNSKKDGDPANPKNAKDAKAANGDSAQDGMAQKFEKLKALAGPEITKEIERGMAKAAGDTTDPNTGYNEKDRDKLEQLLQKQDGSANP